MEFSDRKCFTKDVNFLCSLWENLIIPRQPLRNFSKFEGDTDSLLAEKRLHVSGYPYSNAKRFPRRENLSAPFVNKMGASLSDEK